MQRSSFIGQLPCLSHASVSAAGPLNKHILRSIPGDLCVCLDTVILKREKERARVPHKYRNSGAAQPCK